MNSVVIVMFLQY